MNILSLAGSDFAPAWRAAGHNVFVISHGAEADARREHPLSWRNVAEILSDAGFQPDLVCYVDDGNFPLLLNPEDIPQAAIFYSIDTYCHPWHPAFSHGFDKVLVAQKDFIPMFADEGADAVWFPLFCRRSGKSGGERDIPVSFVGSIGLANNPGRGPFLREFRKAQPLVVMSGDYAPIFGRSEIVLNQTAFGEINFRCFEAMAFGAALLMERCENGFADLFAPGENILPPYARGNAREAAAIAAAYLKMPEALSEISSAGRELVLSKHSVDVRAREIVGMAEELLANDAVGRRLAERRERRIFVRGSFGILAADLRGERWQRYREFFFARSLESD